MALICFGALPCRRKKNLMTARVSMLLKSRLSLTCFGACFLPGPVRSFCSTKPMFKCMVLQIDTDCVVCGLCTLCIHCTALDCIMSSIIRGYWKWLTGSYTVHSRCNPVWFLSVGLRQGSGLCSFSSRKYHGTEGTNQNRHWNHHRWHATNSLERTRLSCWCL